MGARESFQPYGPYFEFDRDCLWVSGYCGSLAKEEVIGELREMRIEKIEMTKNERLHSGDL